jgi:hypothetical protein
VQASADGVVTVKAKTTDKKRERTVFISPDTHGNPRSLASQRKCGVCAWSWFVAAVCNRRNNSSKTAPTVIDRRYKLSGMLHASRVFF